MTFEMLRRFGKWCFRTFMALLGQSVQLLMSWLLGVLMSTCKRACVGLLRVFAWFVWLALVVQLFQSALA